MTEETTQETIQEIKVVSKKKLIAKRNFSLNCPPHLVKDIKKGDDLSGIPEKFLINLKTEEVI